MTTLTIVGTLYRAQLIQSFLRGSGIESFIPDEISIQNGLVPFNVTGGVRLQVEEKDFSRAQELLGEFMQMDQL